MIHLFLAATLATAFPFSDLPSQFEKIAPAAQGRVGVAAQLLEKSLEGSRLNYFNWHSARTQGQSRPF